MVTEILGVLLKPGLPNRNVFGCIGPTAECPHLIQICEYVGLTPELKNWHYILHSFHFSQKFLLDCSDATPLGYGDRIKSTDLDFALWSKTPQEAKWEGRNRTIQEI